MTPLLLFIPILSALIGWFTNYLAVKMLFFPREPKKILFLRFHGIIPKRMESLAEKLGEIVANELVDISIIKKKMGTIGNDRSIIALIDKKINTVLSEKVKSINPMISMFLSDELLEKFKAIFMEEIQSFLPELAEKFADNALNDLNLKEQVQNKVLSFSTIKMEEILYSILKKEFGFIELLGGIIGFIIGTLQVVLLLLTNV